MSPPSVDELNEAAKLRCSVYTLTNKSTIPDERIKEIVDSAVKHAPSPFNVQSARAVVLLKKDHEKLWDIGDAMVKRVMPEQLYETVMAPRVAGFRAAYGSVLWFESQDALDGLKDKNAQIQNVITEWSDHSNGMHQFLVWTAFELEGLGCNLQHFNFNPIFVKEVLETWDLPKDWKLKSQLVFGTPQDGFKRRAERTYMPLEDRVKMIGS